MRKLVKIIISEPDFEIGGSNELFGEFLGQLSLRGESSVGDDYYLIKLDNPIQLQGKNIDKFVVAPRHSGEHMDSIFEGKSIMVGIAYVKPNSKVEIGKVLASDDTVYAFIGSIELCRKPH